MTRLSHLPRHVLIGMVRLYQWLVSPMLHGLFGPHSGCRFQPTCSQYAVDALRRFGVLRGISLVGWRLLRCGPWSKGGYDPVPESAEGETDKAPSNWSETRRPKPCHCHSHHRPSHG